MRARSSLAFYPQVGLIIRRDVMGAMATALSGHALPRLHDRSEPWAWYPAWVAPSFGRWGEAIKFEIGPAECRCGGAVRGSAGEPLAITHRQSNVVSGLKS